MIVELKQYFTAARIAKRFKKASPVACTVLDDLVPADARPQYESPVIPVSEIQQLVRVVPVVSRGAASISLDSEVEATQYIVPLPIRLNTEITAVDLNNLKLASPDGRESWAKRKQLAMRQSVKLTTEAMFSQAVFNGGIAFPLMTKTGQYSTYKVSYNGSINEILLAESSKWNHAEMTLLKVYKQLNDMSTKLDNTGHGGEKITYAGDLAFTQLLSLIEDTDKPKIPVRIQEDGTIKIGPHTIKNMAETYLNPEDGGTVNKCPPKEIRMVSKGYAALFYGPVDDLDGKLQPLPMFVKPVRKQDPSEDLLIGESKPLPAVSPGATCKAVVLP